MADSSPNPDSKRDASLNPNPGLRPGTPRWVKLFGLIALVLVLLFVILHLTGNSPSGH